MKIKKIIVPAVWEVSGNYEFTYNADMPEEEAIKTAIRLAEEAPLPKIDCPYLKDSFSVDEEGIEIKEDETEREEGFVPDLPWDPNTIVEVQFRAKMNRNFTEEELKKVVPKSYSIKGRGESTFGFEDTFCEAGCYKDGYFFLYDPEGISLVVTQEELDTKKYPDSQVITPDILKAAVFTDVDVSLGGCKEDLKIERIDQMRITFKDLSTVDIPRNELKHVNAKLSPNQCNELIGLCIKNDLTKEALTLAEELADDVYSQRYLLGLLEKKGVDVCLTSMTDVGKAGE